MSIHYSTDYDVVIVGGGVVGTALAYLLRTYTNIDRIAIFEKYPRLAQVNSHASNNSQTLHFGDIETNYPLEKAKKVKHGADMVARYLDRFDEKKELHCIFSKMVLAVGQEESEALSRRFEEFKELFPQLRKIGRDEIARLEPAVVEGRDPSVELLALQTDTGYTVNYAKLAESFVERARTASNRLFEVHLSQCIDHVEKVPTGYKLTGHGVTYTTRVVVFATGANSMISAKEVGYGKDLMILPVAGSFFHIPKRLNGKVYTLQMKKLPFAAVHGDPDLAALDKTRFGPTAKVIPMFERGRYKTVKDFLKIFDLRLDSLASIVSILSDTTYLKFVFKNVLYDLPWIGRLAFLPNIRKVIPTVKLKDVTYAKGFGGIRPQVVNRKTRQVSLGEAKIVGDKAIFNITPSPGASTCLHNAENDLRTIIGFFGNEFQFDEARFLKDFQLTLDTHE